MDLSLKGKKALICGGSGGIGLASAIELSLLGADCILLARNPEKLDAAVGKLDTAGGQQHSWRMADFVRPEEVRDAVSGLLKEEGVFHILVNNTGGPRGGPILEAKTGAFLDAFKQHLVCNQMIAQEVVPGMRSAGYGRIINIISTSVKAPIRNLGVSNTTRWAVAAWSKTLATELAGSGITVNNVLPGSTLTERLKFLFHTMAEHRNTRPEVVEKEWLAEIPMGRFGEAREIAATVAFLASPAAAYITGASIPVDGGRTPGI